MKMLLDGEELDGSAGACARWSTRASPVRRGAEAQRMSAMGRPTSRGALHPEGQVVPAQEGFTGCATQRQHHGVAFNTQIPAP